MYLVRWNVIPIAARFTLARDTAGDVCCWTTGSKEMTSALSKAVERLTSADAVHSVQSLGPIFAHVLLNRWAFKRLRSSAKYDREQNYSDEYSKFPC